MAKPRLTGLARLRAAFGHSLRGLRDLWRAEEAARIEIACLAASLVVAPLIAPDLFRAAILICAVLFVLIVEVVNSAIEAVVDRIGPERHELSRIAKDMGSLAVLLAAVLAGLLWLAALWQAVALLASSA